VCTGPHTFQHLYVSTCMDWILGRMSERSSCGASFGNVKISDLDFADDAVIFAETLDILLGALEVLNEESEPLGLRFSWVKTKILAFNDIFDAAVLSVPVSGEDVEVVESFTYLGSDIHVSAGCESGVNRRLGLATCPKISFFIVMRPRSLFYPNTQFGVWKVHPVGCDPIPQEILNTQQDPL